MARYVSDSEHTDRQRRRPYTNTEGELRTNKWDLNIKKS